GDSRSAALCQHGIPPSERAVHMGARRGRFGDRGLERAARELPSLMSDPRGKGGCVHRRLWVIPSGMQPSSPAPTPILTMSGAADEDRSLVDRFLANRDEQAFREIYKQHGSALYGFARSLVQRDGVAEDIVQEAWLRAVRRLPSFDGRSSLRTWLIGFVVHCCHEPWRDERRQGVGLGGLGGGEPGGDTGDTALPASGHAEKLDLERALARLAPGYRTVLLLHDLHG